MMPMVRSSTMTLEPSGIVVHGLVLLMRVIARCSCVFLVGPGTDTDTVQVHLRLPSASTPCTCSDLGLSLSFGSIFGVTSISMPGSPHVLIKSTTTRDRGIKSSFRYLVAPLLRNHSIATTVHRRST